MSADAQLDAVIGAINAPLPVRRAYDIETAGASPVNKIIVTVHRRYVPPQHAGGEVSVEGGRVVTQYVASQHGNVDNFRRETRDALEGQLIPFDGDYLGPFTFETTVATERNETYFVGADSWTF